MQKIFTFIFYFIIASISSELLYRGFKNNSKNRQKYYIFFTIFLMSLIAALRATTGTDSEMYIKAYNDIDSIFRWQDFEIGFVLLIRFLNFLHFPYHSLFFIMETGTLLFLFLSLNKFKDDIDIKFSVFLIFSDFYMMSFNGMRQIFAVSIGLYAMILYIKTDGINCSVSLKNKLSGIGLIIFASLFHKSVMVCMAIIVVKFIFNNRHYKIILFGSSVIILFMINHRDILGKLVYFFTHNYYYVGYVVRDAYTDGTVMGGFIKIAPILAVTVFSYKNYSKKYDIKIFSALMVCGYLFSLLENITNTQVGRAGWYFSYFSIIIVPYCMKHPIWIGNLKFKSKDIKMFMYIYILLYFLYNYCYRGFSEVVPYMGLFNEV